MQVRAGFAPATRKFVSIREFYDIFRPITRTHAAPTPKRMASDKELADFLAGVERRAFKQTVYAVRDDDASLDIVQDAMIKLAEKYGDRPAAELPLLFQRILQNAMHDYFRRPKCAILGLVYSRRSATPMTTNSTHSKHSRRNKVQRAQKATNRNSNANKSYS